jgi:phytoene synthase
MAELRKDDLEACRNLLRHGSKSFFAASLTLPGRVRAPATVVYAMCRVLDDEVDRDGASADVVQALGERLERAYSGRPDQSPIDRAFSVVVQREALPRAIFDALLEGFAWDLEGRTYETIDDTLDYCVRVAGTVGVCMSALMGRREALTLERACDLGIAMQLTNIARDIGEDAKRGRIYLPRTWLREAGIDPEIWLAAPVASDAMRATTKRLLDLAKTHYDRADAGIGALPVDCRPAIRAARLIYSQIGLKIEQNDYDSVGQRAVVSGWEKARLLARATLPSAAEAATRFRSSFAGARSLVEAVAR